MSERAERWLRDNGWTQTVSGRWRNELVDDNETFPLLEAIDIEEEWQQHDRDFEAITEHNERLRRGDFGGLGDD